MSRIRDTELIKILLGEKEFLEIKIKLLTDWRCLSSQIKMCTSKLPRIRGVENRSVPAVSKTHIIFHAVRNKHWRLSGPCIQTQIYITNFAATSKSPQKLRFELQSSVACWWGILKLLYYHKCVQQFLYYFNCFILVIGHFILVQMFV